MLVPAAYGGGEVAPREMVEALEELALADGSAAWCAMVSATAGFVAGWLEADAAGELFGGGAVAAGVYAPIGTAERDGDRLVVSGRWPFGSFGSHADLLLGGVRVEGGTALAVFPAADVEFVETWFVSGLRGTGSNDFQVSRLEVPASHVVSLADAPQASGPLYAFPVFGLLALGIGGVALGIARAAIDELRELAVAKKPSGSSRRLAERSHTQSEVAKAVARLAAARALVMDEVDRAWAAAQRGEGIAFADQARLRMAATHATRSSAEVVDAMYDLGGGTSLYSESPLQRRFRDVHAATQHAMVAPATWELTGRLLLGLETDVTQL